MKRNIVLHILFALIMEKRKIDVHNIWFQWVIILTTNLFFVCKYFPRAELNPILSAIIYGVFVTCMFVLYRNKIFLHITEKHARLLSIILVAGVLFFISCAIVFISPYSIQVDRWSATTFFLEGLVRGEYPYGIHTHVFENNYPSPFPLWHYLNFPFWLIGDVGWIQAFSLLVFIFAIHYYFSSWKALLSVLLLLYISPSYWWELVTRSDGLSNALLVCSCILFIECYPIEMKNKWWLLSIISGCIASTRLSAIIPIALYMFRPWFEAPWKIKISFVAIVICIVFAFFAPYIFWDIETWVFFQRNPFMSQTSPGNFYILISMVILAICIAYKKKTFMYYLDTTSLFMFIFMLISQLGVIWSSREDVTILDNCCDISYFTLSLPYAICAILMHNEKKSLLLNQL